MILWEYAIDVAVVYVMEYMIAICKEIGVHKKEQAKQR